MPVPCTDRAGRRGLGASAPAKWPETSWQAGRALAPGAMYTSPAEVDGTGALLIQERQTRAQVAQLADEAAEAVHLLDGLDEQRRQAGLPLVVDALGKVAAKAEGMLRAGQGATALEALVAVAGEVVRPGEVPRATHKHACPQPRYRAVTMEGSEVVRAPRNYACIPSPRCRSMLPVMYFGCSCRHSWLWPAGSCAWTQLEWAPPVPAWVWDCALDACQEGLSLLSSAPPAGGRSPAVSENTVWELMVGAAFCFSGDARHRLESGT